MWSIFSFIVFLTTLLISVQSIEIIYDTDNLKDAQYFDCLHYTNILTNTYSIKYCIQRKNVTSVQKQINQCQKGASAYSFFSLFERDVHPSLVLSTFRSGIEQADRYGAYFFRKKVDNFSILNDDDVICNCSSLKDVFGRYCEYELYFGPRLAQTVLGARITSQGHSLYGQLQRRRVCYTSIDCDYGLLCLDWAEICDGVQQCMDGADEENCQEIEMNECEQNEFRCQNGLCIPEEYWVDGELDCQDASDELNDDMFERTCFMRKGIECDEHMCQANSFPCGDGKCTYRYMFSKQLISRRIENGVTFQCSTLRDLAFQCELHEPLPLWTVAGGFCMFFRAPWSNINNMTDEVFCEFLFKCQFSPSQSEACPANDDLHRLLNTKCKTTFGLIPYPPGKLVSPRIHTFYKVDHQFAKDHLPDHVIIKGQLRCPNFHLTIDDYQSLDKNFTMKYLSYMLMPYFADWMLCRLALTSVAVPQLIRNYSSHAPHLEASCWNQWVSLFNLSSVDKVIDLCRHHCLSLYRIHDGISDCVEGVLDEKTTITSSIQHSKNHCLNCITHDIQAVCLPTNIISSSRRLCAQGQDIYVAGGTVRIDSFKCTFDDTSQCHIIRDYIIHSSINRSNETASNSMVGTSNFFSFLQYCDTYFDTEENIDETIDCLNKWICATNEYRCLTGQCIPFDWLCDGEWDCSDASDEQRLFLQINDFADKHNRRLLNFTEIKLRCFNRYKEQAFSNICNVTLEYPCLLANVDDPLNLISNRPCIKLEQIGDGHPDCLGKSDERNLLKCNAEVLGWNFGCTGIENNKCLEYMYFCTETTSFSRTCGTEDFSKACFYRSISNCNGPKDVLCFNKTCQPNARCDRKWDCLNGEDEYWCYFDPQTEKIDGTSYRYDRRIKYQSDATLTSYLATATNFPSKLKQEPSVIDPIQQFNMMVNVEKHIQTVNSYSNDDVYIDKYLDMIRKKQWQIVGELPFICNLGIPIKHIDGHNQCLCSPSHYGDYCEFQADRISVATHLNLTKYYQNYTLTIDGNSTVLVSSTFLYIQRIIDRHEFHIYPNMKRMKQKFYFAYPRTTEFQSQKRRLYNGTHLYSIRFEAFSLKPTSRPNLIGVWHFPIQFEFLPAFRFAKVLHFNDTNKNETCSLPCGLHGQCFRLENEIKQSICSCESGWYGDRCDQFDERCGNFCHPHALCRPQERGFINGDQRPACLCSHGWFGPTCHLTYPKCTECQNGGSCYPTYDLTHTQPFECVCTTDFYGVYCQFPKQAVILRFDKISSEVSATSIQYYGVKREPIIDLYLHEQQVYFGRPMETQIKYEKNNGPSVILIKSYTKQYQLQGPMFHLVYSQEKPDASINMSVQLVSENECAHTHTLFDTKIIQSVGVNLLVFKYHDLCQFHRQNRSKIVCFRDNLYFCLCNMTLEHAQCLRFDPYSDTCQHCLSGGQCIRGSLQQKQDFICLCRRCMYGSVCQFSTELFSFTLDSLIIKDVQNRRDLSIAIYISITFLIFLIGCLSNLCSLLVFSRKNPRKIGVGNYLYLVSIINIISLLFIFVKIIHILLGSAGILTKNTINLILCKIFSSFLSITVRANYWLISLITIERLSTVIFPTKTTIKKPKTSFLLSLTTILIICGMHIHEILHYTIISADPQNINSTAILCVTNFDKQSWSIYNQANVLIHHLVPFIIQVIGITLLIVLAAKSRAKTNTNRTTGFSEILKKQFKLQRELYITPAVIIFAALPQLIFTTSFACKELNSAWQRYILLITYIFSFIPQICGFIIFVLPSTTYQLEFRNTKMGQHFFRFIGNLRKNNVRAKK